MPTKQDPTGQARNRNKTTRRLNKRLRAAERRIKQLFRDISRTRRTVTPIVNQIVYEYEYDQQEFDRLTQFILNEELLETQTGEMPFGWYWKEDVELPYRQGTAEEVRDFNFLIEGAIAAGVLINGLPPQMIPIEQVLLSEPYRTALNSAQVSNFQTIKTLSERTAAQVIQRVNAGIQAGNTPTDIAAEISDRFDVAKSSARRIAETEVNKAYNDARLRAADVMEQQTGLRAAVIHISALLPTTRQTHADRHGNAYTTADQLAWWNTGANRINCKCTTRSVLIDSNGKVVQAELQQELKEERSFFDND